jgi:hypothetical protein
MPQSVALWQQVLHLVMRLLRGYSNANLTSTCNVHHDGGLLHA